MKKQPEIIVRLPEDLMRRLIYISEAEGRTPNNQFVFLLRNNIQYFERTKGKMDKALLDKIDLTPYLKEDKDDVGV